jgi:DNA polymerase III epsilon subunit-like protein
MVYRDMAPFLAFDCETTGLPSHRRCGFKNLEAFDSCRLVSIAIVEFDEDHKEIGSYHYIVRPDGFQVAATEIHGITHERALEEGRDFHDIYDEITYMFGSIPTIVGHNIEFDINCLSSEIWRRDLSLDVFETITPVCTLKMIKNIFFEPRKLGIVYQEMFGKELEGAHDALNDARAAGEVYAHLIKGDPRVYKSIGVKTVWLKVSDIGASVDMCGFKKPREIIDNLWQKYNPTTFKGQTSEQRQVTALKISPSVIQNVYSNATVFSGTSNDVQEAFKKAEDIINVNTEMTHEQKLLVTQHIRKTLYTNHGIAAEALTAQTMETTGELIEDETFYKFPLCRIMDTEYILCGRVDRVEIMPDGTHNLVEIKNRTNKLFNKVRDYENAQVQAYLQMNRDWRYARLVEQYNSQSVSHTIVRDDVYWGNLVDKMTEFCRALHHYMSS